jgi:hypothetical protein
MGTRRLEPLKRRLRLGPLIKPVFESLVSGHDFSRADKALYFSFRAGFSRRHNATVPLFRSLFRGEKNQLCEKFGVSF